MGRLEDRLRRLEEQLVSQPSIDEYLDAKHRQEARALHKVAGLLAVHGFDGGYLFSEANRRMLGEDSAERQEKDRDRTTWARSSERSGRPPSWRPTG